MDQTATRTGSRDLVSAWDNAYTLFKSKLDPKELEKLAAMMDKATFSDLLRGVTEAREIAERKRFKYSGTIQKILKTVNEYAIVGDIMVQSNPEVTSLAWGAFRFILQAAVQEGETAAKLVDSLDWISRIVFRADEYTKMFSHQQVSARQILQRLHDDLVELFAQALEFLFRTKLFFQKSSIRRHVSTAFKPFGQEFQGSYDRILKLEGEVEKDIRLLNGELDIIRQEVENGVWLMHADFSSDIELLNKEHLDGTSGWFTAMDKVRSWIDPQSAERLLWVHGKPGAGKSMLASQLISQLSSSTLPIPRAFCKKGAENKSSIISVLCNIIYQLLESSGTKKRELHSIVYELRVAEKTSSASSLRPLWPALGRILGAIDGCFCIIDGLDECNDTPDEISDFITRLATVFKESQSNTKVAVFSRIDLSSHDQSTVSSWSSHHIEQIDVADDIKHFATVKLDESTKLRNHREKGRLLEALIEGSEGMILWTRLMITELERGHWNVEAVLKKPPKGLNTVYGGIIQRLAKESDAQRCRNIFQLALAASRPLRREEFVLAIAVMEGLSDHEDYDSRGNMVEESREIITSVSPLITLMPDNTLQIIHASLKDYLLGSGIGETLGIECKSFFFDPHKLHGSVAVALVEYLSFSCFEGYLDTGDIDQKFPLLRYSSSQFIWHIVRVKEREESAKCAEALTNFFHSTQGWRWLQRFMDYPEGYPLDRGQLRVLQADLKSWIDALPIGMVQDKSVFDDLVISLTERALEGTRIHNGLEGSVDASVASELGVLYWEQGRLSEAETYFTQLFEFYSASLGIEHQRTIAAKNNLASTYSKQGRWDEAEVLKKEVVEDHTKVFGPEHQYTLISMDNLASLYASQGRWDEAEELQDKALEVFTRILGLEHPDTLKAMDNLAATYSNQGRPETEELQKKALEARSRVLGKDHPETLSSMNGLSLTFSNQGRWDEAEELQKKALESLSRVLGPDHRNTLATMGNLGSTYSSQGRWAEAEAIQTKVLESYLRIFGPEHPDTLTIMSNLGSVYSRQGRWAEAEELQNKVVEVWSSFSGPENINTLDGINNLITTYLRQDRRAESEDLQLKAFEGYSSFLGPGHPKTLYCLDNLATTYSEQGRWAEALELRMKELRILLPTLGPEHPDTLVSVENLALAKFEQGRGLESIPSMEHVIMIRSRTIGETHPDTLRSIQFLAKIRAHLEDNKSSEGGPKEVPAAPRSVVENRSGSQTEQDKSNDGEGSGADGENKVDVSNDGGKNDIGEEAGAAIDGDVEGKEHGKEA